MLATELASMSSDTVLDESVMLFVLGTADQIRQLNEFLGIQSPNL